MKKILKFLKCKDKEEVIYKMRSYEGTQEIEELKEDRGTKRAYTLYKQRRNKKKRFNHYKE